MAWVGWSGDGLGDLKLYAKVDCTIKTEWVSQQGVSGISLQELTFLMKVDVEKI